MRNDGLSACVGSLRAATRAERDEPAPVRRPTARKPAPGLTVDPSPPAEAPSPEPAADPLPETTPQPEPNTGFTTSD